MFGFFRKIRRKALKAKPFGKRWRLFLSRELPMYQYLSQNKKKELENHSKIFLAEKNFIGAGGFEVTEQMKILISAQASVLLLGRKTDYFPHVESIVLYPSTFVSRVQKYAGGGFELEEPEARVGEFCDQTREIVFSWSSVLSGINNPKDGRNVVLHEFAHQIDSESGAIDGTPKLQSFAAYRQWCETMEEEFIRLKRDIAKDHHTVIDDYGSLCPAEFFAVVTETFFEKGEALKNKHPKLYQILSDFYQQDPAKFMNEAS